MSSPTPLLPDLLQTIRFVRGMERRILLGTTRGSSLKYARSVVMAGFFSACVCLYSLCAWQLIDGLGVHPACHNVVAKVIFSIFFLLKYDRIFFKISAELLILY